MLENKRLIRNVWRMEAGSIMLATMGLASDGWPDYRVWVEHGAGDFRRFPYKYRTVPYSPPGM